MYSNTHFKTIFNSYVVRIEEFLLNVLPLSSHPPLYQAMHYSVLNGGKRIRPFLVYATGVALGAPLEQLDSAASAVELIHCYSLIHDDLPSMDNDDLRRGKPTCHKAFNEATAILAGDALQTLAFELLSDSKLNKVSSEQQINMILTLAKASGSKGMVQGQALDMASEGQVSLLTLDELRFLHQQKTGALIKASVGLGAIAANCTDTTILAALNEYADCVGLAFQVQDDILDITGNVQSLGKNTGMDNAHNKTTFPALLGLEPAKEYAKKLSEQAMNAIDSLGKKGQILREMAKYCILRIQ